MISAIVFLPQLGRQYLVYDNFVLNVTVILTVI